VALQKGGEIECARWLGCVPHDVLLPPSKKNALYLVWKSRVDPQCIIVAKNRPPATIAIGG
jgi:hypothetical protein